MAAILLFLPWIVASGLASVGLLANWYFGITDWKTAAIFVAVIVSVAVVAQSNSVWSRFIVVAIIAFGCYLKGHVDGAARIEAKYDAARIVEDTRQRAANEAAQKQAEEAQKKLEADAKVQAEQQEKLSHEAQSDPNSNRDSLSVDAVRRINKLRHGKPEPETPRPTDPKGPTTSPDPTPARPPRVIGKHKVSSTDRRGDELRRQQIRAVSPGTQCTSAVLPHPGQPVAQHGSQVLRIERNCTDGKALFASTPQEISGRAV